MKKIENYQSGIDFDFDHWMKLAKENPETFEKQRQELIQTAINEAPQHMNQRLKGLQWHIDSEIKLAKNPMDGCLKIYQMMMDSVYQPNGLLDALTMTEGVVKSNDNKNVIQLRNNAQTSTTKK